MLKSGDKPFVKIDGLSMAYRDLGSGDPIVFRVQPRFRRVRSDEGEKLVLEQNVFLEQSIVRGTIRPYTDAEMSEYRRPFLQPGEGRRPMLTWPRQLPIGGEPSDVAGIVNAYAAWLSTNEIPNLYIRAERRDAFFQNDRTDSDMAETEGGYSSGHPLS